MKEQTKLAFDFARDSTKQLITLGTGIVALSVTFLKDVISQPTFFEKTVLISSWILFLISIGFGVFTLLALTGNLQPSREEKEPSIYASNVTLMSSCQILVFLLALTLTVLFGVIAVI